MRSNMLLNAEYTADHGSQLLLATIMKIRFQEKRIAPNTESLAPESFLDKLKRKPVGNRIPF
jgi:hypothetical protein